MSWQARVCVNVNTASSPTSATSSTETGAEPSSSSPSMDPGLTGAYDQQLREKAGMHIPPPPPEFMGVEGEYDQSGLAKRVALALDQSSDIQDVETLSIVQQGCKISFLGKAPNQHLIDRVVDVARRVDGTREVDVSQVVVA